MKNIFIGIILCLILSIFIGCDRVRDFGTIDNPCDTVHCKQHENETSICVTKCEDGIYAWESNKLKLSEDYKTYEGR